MDAVKQMLLVTLALRMLIVLVNAVSAALLVIRSYSNGPVTNALVFYFFANTFAKAWYVLANYEAWFYDSAYLQTFGIIVWIPDFLVSVMVLAALWRSRPSQYRRSF